MTMDRRPFGMWTATAMVVGGMIGAGIFQLPAYIAPYGWIAVIAWIISIAGVMAIGYVMAMLSRQTPEQTSAVAVTGAVLGPTTGALVGWSYWISNWTAVAAIAGSAVGYLGALEPWFVASPVNSAIATAGLIWLFTLTNMAGARLAGQIQVATTVLKLLPLIFVIGIVLWLAGSERASAPVWPGTGPGYGGLTAAVTLTLFPLVGFEAAGLVAERVRDPGRNILRATMIGTALVGLLYVVVGTGIAFNLPADKVAGSTAPFTLFVETYLGSGAGKFVAVFAAISAIGALNCWVLVQGELPLGMTRAGLLPAWFGRVNAKDAPVVGLLLASILATLLVASTADRSLSKAMEFAILLTTSSALWFYLAICVAGLVRRVALIPAALALPFCLWALWGAGTEASAWSLALMLTALPLYRWARRET
ncbi:amino acid permease [Sphingomonas sp. J344]|nr:amino acid permease [Sphingomonas sp. J344]MCR5869474.1 amino acid permease [Sphingomonas sp. J344]